MKLKYINIALASLVMFASCNKVLDKQNLSNVPPDLLFSDSTLFN